MAPVSDGKETGLPPPLWKEATSRSAIGAPSTGLSLVGLRPRRARLRFTQRQKSNQTTVEEQEEARVLVSIEPATVLNP
jgi:hypothetical protein